jgi:hypothetical protein
VAKSFTIFVPRGEKLRVEDLGNHESAESHEWGKAEIQEVSRASSVVYLSSANLCALGVLCVLIFRVGYEWDRNAQWVMA